MKHKKAVFWILTMVTIAALLGACAPPAAPMSEVMEEVVAEEPMAPAAEVDTSPIVAIEPPDDMKRLYELTMEFKTLMPGTPEYIRVGQEIGDIHMENMYIIGILGAAPAPMIVHNRLGNKIPTLITGFEFFREYPYRPDQWYIKEDGNVSTVEGMTVANMQGVPEGKYPTQYELEEFETLTGTTLTFTDRGSIDPRLVEIFGEIPTDVNERLPEEPLVVVPYNEIGTYGGELQGLSLGPESGNSEFMSWRHNNFLRYAEDLVTIVPNVVKDYSVNADTTEFTFTLRKGHKWSDGAPFTVDDVLFWWEDVILNEELTPTVPSYWIFGGEPMTVEKVDDVTFVIKTAAPAPGLIPWLASTWITPAAPRHFLESKHIKYNPDINDEAVAEGFASWVEYFFSWYGEWNDSVHRYGVPRLEAWLLVDEEDPGYQVMMANPYYFKVDTIGQQLPYADRTRESYSQDPQVLELKVINGEVDQKAQSLSFASVPVFKSNEESGNYKLYLSESASDGPTVAFNCTHRDPVLRELFSKKEFNYAMSMALDRSEFNKVTCFGECDEISTGVPIHPSASFAKPEWYTYMTEYNPDEANKLLDELGLDQRDAEGWRLRPDGNRLEIFINYTIQSTRSEIMNLVKSYWEAVGVKTNIKEIDTELYRAQVSNNDHDVASFTSGSTLEPTFLGKQYRFYPPFGDKVLEPICGLGYQLWLESSGE